MNESNPYAPPQVSEVAVQVNRCWLLQGDSLLVKNGATLPRVDLDTGLSEHEIDLHIQKWSHQRFSLINLFFGLLAFAIYKVADSYFTFDFIEAFPLLWMLFFLLARFTSLSGKGAKLSTIWFFVDTDRYKRKIWRRNLRLVVLVISMVILIPMFIYYQRDYADIDTQFTLFLLGIGIILLLGIWHALDRITVKVKYHSDDWLKIASIHPYARTFLENLEREEQTLIAEERIPKTRRVRTMFLYRLPLRMLLYTTRNPLKMLVVVLMKFLRSKYLEQVFYDSYEASRCSVETLSTAVRDASDQWLSQHPSWSMLDASSLDSPMGNLLTETISLTSADRATIVLISQYTMPQAPNAIRIQYAMVTWINEGKNSIETYNCPYLALEDPQNLHRTYAKPSGMLEEHMRHTMKHAIYFPKDIDEIHELLKKRQEKNNALLEAKKIHSPVTEYVNGV